MPATRSRDQGADARMASPTNEPVRIAIAGGGYGAKVALPVYSKLEEFEPVAIWSRRAERARELADDAGLELGTSDLDKLLSTPGSRPCTWPRRW